MDFFDHVVVKGRTAFSRRLPESSKNSHEKPVFLEFCDHIFSLISSSISRAKKLVSLSLVELLC